ncbi:MAG: T9SS type A sorting domain-containing protein [Bacteroidota bacterium]
MTQHTIRWMVLSIAILCCLSDSYGQTKRYVDINEASCSGPHCWPGALISLEDALALSSSGDTIWVAAGTYLPNTSVNGRNASFHIPSGVLMFGGFSGDEISLDQRDVSTNKTILSGDVNGDDGSNFANNGDNLYTIVKFSFASAQTRLDGFTLSGGNANDPTANNDTPGRSGGAIFNDRNGMNTISEPIIANCSFQNNYALAFGGAIYNNGSNFGQTNSSISSCTFTANRADNAGGAVYNNGSYTGECNPIFTKCHFEQNRAFVAGGAVYNDAIGNGEASPDLVNCQFIGNNAIGASTSDVSYAGAVYNFGKDGGNSSPQFVNCVFARNESFAAGCVYSLGDAGTASPEFTNCVFFRNTANQNGGAIYANAGSGSSDPVITNSIFWGNKAATIWQGDNFRLYNGSITISHSIVDVNNCSELYRGEIGTVSCTELTMLYNLYPSFRDTANNDFRLLIGSSALNAGNNAAISGYSEDLACDTRIKDGTVDIGAYEGSFTPMPVELMAFRAQYISKDVHLQWTTATEIQNSHFEIQRSRNGQTFVAIKRVEGAGNSRSIRQYNSIDSEPIPGLSYYRLKQIDFDGTVAYSDVQAIDIQKGGKILAYPNPVKAELYIALDELEAGPLQFEVFNSQGQLLFGGETVLNRKGKGQLVLPQVRNLATGTYFVRFYNDNYLSEQIRFSKVWD